jgi:hypothetical protein
MEFVLPETTSIAALAADRYGKDALGRIDEILSLNTIPDPDCDPGGDQAASSICVTMSRCKRR